MKRNSHKANAVEILHRRYVGDNENRKASLEAERVNAEVARTIYELRKEAGLKQRELAEIIGTTQSVISRLEDADYNGHSLSMLSRIAKALNRNLTISMTDSSKKAETRRYVFQEVAKGLRKEKGFKIDKFAQKSGINKEDVIAIERNPDYMPTPLVLHKLSKFYKISQRKIAILAGAIKEIPSEMEAETSRFAAQSESFSNLTEQERHTLDEFVKFLRTEDSE